MSVAEARARATCRVVVTLQHYLVRWHTDDPELWRDLLADWRATFPQHRDAVWRATGKCWSVPLRHHARLFAWLDAWFAGDNLWIDEGADEDRHAGVPPATSDPGDELARAFATLHLLQSAPPALVHAAYRTLARLYHPDTGGSDQQMTALTAAYELLREHAR